MSGRRPGYTDVTLDGKIIGFYGKADDNGRYPCFVDGVRRGIGTKPTTEEAIEHIKDKFREFSK